MVCFACFRTNIDDVGTENMNPEDIYNSIKQTSADIQNLSKLDSHFEDFKKDSTSQDSGIQGSLHDICSTSPDARDRPQYNPQYYQDDVGCPLTSWPDDDCDMPVTVPWPPQIVWSDVLCLHHHKRKWPSPHHLSVAIIVMTVSSISLSPPLYQAASFPISVAWLYRSSQIFEPRWPRSPLTIGAWSPYALTKHVICWMSVYPQLLSWTVCKKCFSGNCCWVFRLCTWQIKGEPVILPRKLWQHDSIILWSGTATNETWLQLVHLVNPHSSLAFPANPTLALPSQCIHF